VVDWMSAVREHGPDPMDVSRGRDSLAQLESIRGCDVLIYVEPVDPRQTIGAWIEVTAAHCYGVPIVLAHDDPPRALPWPAAWLDGAARERIFAGEQPGAIADVAERAGVRSVRTS